jgi:hypothetical protein
MKASVVFGLLLLGVGVVFQPIGWMYSHWFTVISFAAIALGVAVLFAGREQEPAGDTTASSGKKTGREMPGDIHGHSGQLSGGRSTAWASHQSSDGGSASD